MSKVKVNGEFFDWRQGMTIASLLRQIQYPYTPLAIKINGELIKEDYEQIAVPAEAEVQIIRIISGG